MSGQAPHRRETWHDAADEQTALWRWLRSEGGARWLVAHFNYSTQDYLPESMAMVKALYSIEENKLTGADPIFVSREMCEVIDAAKQTFQPEPLYATDFLTPCGFMYYEKPFEVLDRFEKPMTIAAFSWTPTVNPDRKGELPPKWTDDANKVLSVASGMALTIYSLSKRDLPEMEGLNPGKLIPTHLTPWWFDMTYDGNDFDVNGKPTGAGWWWRIAQVSLRLMQQRLAVRRSERPDRPTRRNWKRDGFGERDVLVVRLRRERDTSLPVEPTGPANYSHRFIVGGHWRQQPYPSEGVVRQIWIAPYEKGPEGAPLVIHPSRAYNWSR